MHMLAEIITRDENGSIMNTTTTTNTTTTIINQSSFLACTTNSAQCQSRLTTFRAVGWWWAVSTASDRVKLPSLRSSRTVCYDRSSTNLCALLVALRSDAKQAAKEEVRDLKFNEDVGKSTDGSQNLTDHAVGSTQRRVNLCTNTCKQFQPF